LVQPNGLLAVSIHPDVTLDFDFEDAASVVDGNPTQLRQLVMSG